MSSDESSSSKDNKKLPMFLGTKACGQSSLEPMSSKRKKLPSLNNDDWQADKRSPVKKRHLDGNLKRLQAESAKRKQQRLQITTVKQALRNIDTGHSKLNKKIVFDDNNKINDDVKCNSGVVRELTSMQLFSDDDEADEKIEQETSFHIREEFEGVQGQKLLSLETRYGNDSRFKLDKRFLEEEETEFSDTQTQNLKHSPNSPADEEEQGKAKSAPSKENIVQNSKLPPSCYYSVTENISSLFSSKASLPQFSLLGNLSDISNPKKVETKIEKDSRGIRRDLQVIIQPKDSSNYTSEPQISQPSNPFKPSGWFFINPDDKKLSEECSFFCLQNSDEEVRNKWLETRPSVLEIFRKMRYEKGRTRKKRTSDKFKKGNYTGGLL